MHEHMMIRVAGVTFKNDDGSSRQAVLKRLAENHSDGYFVSLEPYWYEDDTAFRVLCDGVCVGNVPKDNVHDVIDIWDDIKSITIHAESFENDNDNTIYRADLVILYGDDIPDGAPTTVCRVCDHKTTYSSSACIHCGAPIVRTGFSVFADSWPIPIASCFAGAVLMQLSRGTWAGVILTVSITALFIVLAVVVRIVRRKKAACAFVRVSFRLRTWYALFLIPLACLILFLGDMLEPKSILPPAGTVAPSAATTYAPAAPSDNDSTSDGMTSGQRNALGAAVSYLDAMPFSRSGLIHQLEYEGYSTSEAAYAADNCGANWEAQALESAKSYLQSSAFSFSGLKEQLEYDGFSDDEAYYGVTQCGADWNEQAVLCAASYLSSMSFSREELIHQLEYEGFSHDQAVYGAAQNGY